MLSHRYESTGFVQSPTDQVFAHINDHTRLSCTLASPLGGRVGVGCLHRIRAACTRAGSLARTPVRPVLRQMVHPADGRRHSQALRDVARNTTFELITLEN